MAMCAPCGKVLAWGLPPLRIWWRQSPGTFAAKLAKSAKSTAGADVDEVKRPPSPSIASSRSRYTNSSSDQDEDGDDDDDDERSVDSRSDGDGRSPAPVRWARSHLLLLGTRRPRQRPPSSSRRPGRSRSLVIVRGKDGVGGTTTPRPSPGLLRRWWPGAGPRVRSRLRQGRAARAAAASLPGARPSQAAQTGGLCGVGSSTAITGGVSGRNCFPVGVN